MADRCATYTYGGVTVNGDSDTDTLVITDDASDQIDGLDGAPVRRQVDNLAGTDGGESQPAHFAPRVITFTGRVHIGTLGGDPNRDRSGYQNKLVTLQKAVVAALEALLNTNSSLAWTDATGASRSIQCMYGMPGGEVKFGGTMDDPTFTFQLLAEDPTIS